MNNWKIIIVNHVFKITSDKSSQSSNKLYNSSATTKSCQKLMTCHITGKYLKEFKFAQVKVHYFSREKIRASWNTHAHWLYIKNWKKISRTLCLLKPNLAQSIFWVKSIQDCNTHLFWEIIINKQIFYLSLK